MSTIEVVRGPLFFSLNHNQETFSSQLNQNDMLILTSHFHMVNGWKVNVYHCQLIRGNRHELGVKKSSIYEDADIWL